MTHEFIITNKGFTDINPVICGYEKCEKNHYSGKTIRDYYLIHFIVNGKGKFISPYGEYTLTANHFFIIHPNEVNYYRADSVDPWEYIWIGFSGKAAEIFSGEKVVYNYNGNIFYDILKIPDMTSMRTEFVASKIFALMCEVFKDNDLPHDYIRMTTDYIDANFMRDITVDDIAGKIGLNQRYLSRIFKNEHGITIQEYLIRKRMELAKALLSKNHRVCETAELVGYRDVFNFSKMFKKYTGTSPKSFREIKETNL